MANSHTLGTGYSPRMRWADIEVPNTAVDMNSWAVSACYPQSTFYPLSDGPSMQKPPDHYDLLSHLLDLSVSQSGTLFPLQYPHDFRPWLAYLRTPPLPFRRRPPQSNCPPCTVPSQDYWPRLEPQTNQGGISTTAPNELASILQSLPPILHRSVQSPMQSYS